MSRYLFERLRRFWTVGAVVVAWVIVVSLCAQAITSGTPDCDNIEYRLGAIHSALHSINRDLYDSAHTIGA